MTQYVSIPNIMCVKIFSARWPATLCIQLHCACDDIQHNSNPFYVVLLHSLRCINSFVSAKKIHQVHMIIIKIISLIENNATVLRY